MKAFEAPRVARNAGSRGKIASLEVSVSRLTSPRPTTVLGSFARDGGGAGASLRDDVVKGPLPSLRVIPRP